MSQKPALRFDHREIAVVFSLFVFVALLMFTVGILVGKGIAQAKFEARNQSHDTAVALPIHDKGHELDADAENEAIDEHPTAHEEHAPQASKAHEKPNHEKSDTEDSIAAKPEPKKEIVIKEEELELIPLGPQKTDWNGLGLKNQKPHVETDKLLENPKIAALTERDTASIHENASDGMPKPSDLSFPKGSFTVQVGSYPGLKDAEERVKALKSLGFAHAYFSAKDLGDSNGTWYRVWLGYFPNYEAAKKSGDKLAARGEVRNYLVRKAEKNGKN